MLKFDDGRGAEARQNAETQQFVLENSKADVSLPEELQALTRLLGARTREFNNLGEFSNVHDAVLERRQQQHAAIEARLVAAIRRGAIWESIRLELERDFDALFGNFGHQLDQLDAAAMRGRL